jgi:hypothetical protein
MTRPSSVPVAIRVFTISNILNTQVKRRYLSKRLRLERNCREVEGAIELEIVVLQVCETAEIVIVPVPADMKEGDSRDENTDCSQLGDEAKGSACTELEDSIPSSPPSPTHSIITSSALCVHLQSFNPSPENGSPLDKLSFESPHSTAAAITGRSEGAGERVGPFHRCDARIVRRHNAAAIKVQGSEAKELEQGHGQGQKQGQKQEQEQEQEGRLVLRTHSTTETDRGGKSDRSVRFLDDLTIPP